MIEKSLKIAVGASQDRVRGWTCTLQLCLTRDGADYAALMSLLF